MLENITKNTHHNCHQLANECCPLNDLHKKRIYLSVIIY
jgi:hypothetical protein